MMAEWKEKEIRQAVAGSGEGRSRVRCSHTFASEERAHFVSQEREVVGGWVDGVWGRTTAQCFSSR